MKCKKSGVRLQPRFLLIGWCIVGTNCSSRSLMGIVQGLNISDTRNATSWFRIRTESSASRTPIRPTLTDAGTTSHAMLQTIPCGGRARSVTSAPLTPLLHLEFWRNLVNFSFLCTFCRINAFAYAAFVFYMILQQKKTHKVQLHLQTRDVAKPWHRNFGVHEIRRHTVLGHLQRRACNWEPLKTWKFSKLMKSLSTLYKGKPFLLSIWCSIQEFANWPTKFGWATTFLQNFFFYNNIWVRCFCIAMDWIFIDFGDVW